jgi:hypothetical protein
MRDVAIPARPLAALRAAFSPCSGAAASLPSPTQWERDRMRAAKDHAIHRGKPCAARRGRRLRNSRTLSILAGVIVPSEAFPIAPPEWFDSPRRNPDLVCAARAPTKGLQARTQRSQRKPVKERKAMRPAH